MGAIEKLGWPLDRIIHAEVWATDDIPADLPPMVEFKEKADQWILDNFGIKVEHICASKRERERKSFESEFYKKRESGKYVGRINGFPMQRGPWCNKLKVRALDKLGKVDIRKDILPSSSETQGGYQFMDSQWSREFGATATSSEMLSTDYRIPNLCQQGKLVYRSQNQGFLIAP